MKKSMMLVLIVLIIITITINIEIASALIRMNEVMYNPKGEDNNNEYIEIYCDENINLSNYVIGDTVNNDTLKLIKSNINKINNNFVLVVEEKFNYTNLNCSVYSSGKNIGNGLSNKGDTIFLFDKNKVIVDKVTYTNNYADGNGKSLSLVNGFWFEDEPSPCKPNIDNNNLVGINNSKNNNTDIKDIKIGVNIKIEDDFKTDEKDLITSKTVFESKRQRVENFIPYFIITILLLISIVLILRR